MQPPAPSYTETQQQTALTVSAETGLMFNAGPFHVHLRSIMSDYRRIERYTVVTWEEASVLNMEKFFTASWDEAVEMFEEKKREAAICNAVKALNVR